MSEPSPREPTESGVPATNALERVSLIAGDVDLSFLAPPQEKGELGRLAHYRVLAPLGKGGMGMVLLAEDTKLRRRAAIKVMLAKAADNQRARERFLREARVAAAVHDDHVVTIYQVDEQNGVPFIAMEYLQGMPLDEFVKKEGLPDVPNVLRIGREIALGLAAAHAQGLVHRDIKPGNVWLQAPNGRVKILDFGLARPAIRDEDDSEQEITYKGGIVGTPAYMSPEQGRGETVDFRTDLFSLGCVLYRLCTGKTPFAGPTTMAVLTALATTRQTPVREINSNVPAALSDLIDTLLAKDPKDRPASADAVSKALQAIEPASGASGPAVVYVPMAVPVQEEFNPWTGIDDSGQATEKASETPTIVAPQRRVAIPVWAWVVIGFLVLLGIGIFGEFWLRKSATEPGTLLVDAPDADVEVVIRKNGTIVRERTKDRLFRLEPGDYSIEIADRATGLRLNPDKFTLKPGDNLPARVTIVKPKVVVKIDVLPESFDLDRRAAETLKPHFETLVLRLKSSGDIVRIESRDALPNEAFALLELSVTIKSRPAHFVPDVLLPAVKELNELRAYFDPLWGAQWTPSDLERLAAMPCRNSIVQFNYPGLDLVKWVDTLKKFPRLEKVNFGVVGAGDKEFARLGELAALKDLSLWGLGEKPPLPVVQSLLTDKGRNALAGLPVSSLTINNSGTLDRSWCEAIAQMPELRTLRLYGTTFGPAEGAALAKSAKLNTLDVRLGDKKATDVIQALAKLDKLESLVLDGAGIGDEHIASLATLKRLVAITLKKTGASEAAIEKLAEALPNCDIESAGKRYAAKKAPLADNVADRQAAETLLPYCDRIVVFLLETNQTQEIRNGDALPKRAFHLIELQFKNQKLGPDFCRKTLMPAIREVKELAYIVDPHVALQWSDNDLTQFATLPCKESLVWFLCSSTALNGHAIDTLKSFPKLAAVHFDAAAATDSHFERLVELKNLERIQLGFAGRTAPMTERAWKGVGAVNATNLLFSNLNGSMKLDAAAAEQLAGSCLMELIFYHSDFEPGALARFVKSKQLRYLHFVNCGLQKVHLTDIGELNRLMFLLLDIPAFPEDHLTELRGASGLHDIHVPRMEVSSKLLTTMAKAMPQTALYWKGSSRAAPQSRGVTQDRWAAILFKRHFDAMTLRLVKSGNIVKVPRTEPLPDELFVLTGLEKPTAKHSIDFVPKVLLPELAKLKEFDSFLDPNSGSFWSEASLNTLATHCRDTLKVFGQGTLAEAGAKKLGAALPKCRIIWSGGTIEPHEE